MIDKVRYIGVFIAVIFLSHACVMESGTFGETFDRHSVRRDLPEILRMGKLTVLVENSSTSYFIYKEKKMGFEYELLKLFAEEIGVRLEVKVVHNLDNIIEMVDRGEGDLIACNYTITKDRNRRVSFSEHFLQARQVLVQRKPDGWEEMEEEEWREGLIKSAEELAGKSIHVWKNSSYYQRLENLQEEIGDTIHIEPVKGNVSGEELVEMVAEGLIDYTVIEDNVAKINTEFFQNLDASLAVSVNQKMGFAMRKSSHLLKAKLDDWLIKFKKKGVFAHIYRRYFEGESLGFETETDNNFVALDGTHISEFDEFFQQAQKKTGWDWRLLSAIAYQESKFNPKAQAFGGAYGMMQFMPNTGPAFGVYPDSDPLTQIMGGAMKLQSDEKYWSMIKDPLQRKKFSLASYNAGRGHIIDAQRLAAKHGLNPNKWDENVETMILNLSKQEYYQDPVVKHGMMRSKTTYNYVRHVMERYLEWAEVYP